MKRSINVLVVSLLLLVVWSGCNKSSGGSGEKITLALKLEKGQVFKQLNKTDQTINQKVMGMATTTKMVTEMYLKQEVLDVADGKANVRVTYERVRSEQENSMAGKMVYDSQDTTAGEPDAQFMGYAGLIGKGFEYTINSEGKVTEVRGVDALFDEIMSKVEGGVAAEQMKSTLKQTFGEEAMKGMMEQMTAHLPSSQVAEGDTWGGEIKMSGPMAMKIANTYTLDKIEADKAVVSLTGEVATNEDANLDLGVMKVEYKLEGTTEGTLEIDRKTGMVLSMKMNQKISGETKMMGMTVPMDIDQVVTLSPY